jgi:hypothetical protein
MAVTDDQVAALRAYLTARTDTAAADVERQFLTLEVLGDKQAIRPPEEARARAQFLLLAALAVGLGQHELEEVLAEGRALADSAIAAAGRSPA